MAMMKIPMKINPDNDLGNDEANDGGQVRQRRSDGGEDGQKSTYQSFISHLLATKYINFEIIYPPKIHQDISGFYQ